MRNRRTPAWGNHTERFNRRWRFEQRLMKNMAHRLRKLGAFQINQSQSQINARRRIGGSRDRAGHGNCHRRIRHCLASVVRRF